MGFLTSTFCEYSFRQLQWPSPFRTSPCFGFDASPCFAFPAPAHASPSRPSRYGCAAGTHEQPSSHLSSVPVSKEEGSSPPFMHRQSSPSTCPSLSAGGSPTYLWAAPILMARCGRTRSLARRKWRRKRSLARRKWRRKRRRRRAAHACIIHEACEIRIHGAVDACRACRGLYSSCCHQKSIRSTHPTFLRQRGPAVLTGGARSTAEESRQVESDDNRASECVFPL
ncbi:hypothetical protein C8R43DRAFT_46206 [Mycena crocata]|nr:hypothetical protein C8R43DRAFT_46206 [Mycena crocata]